MNRRPFLWALGAGLAGRLTRLHAQGAVTVDAVPSLLHGHPDGQTTLVRFTAAGVDAPAGRLRVHDLGTGRLLGTAGMIPRGGVLTGELWLPLSRPARVRSELETPTRRGAIRSIHALAPTPRWTIYWLTLVSPDALEAAFATVPTWLRAVDAHAMVAAGVRVNPWRPLPPEADHLDLLRLTVPAAIVSRATGVLMSRLALHDGEVSPHLDRALRGAGVDLTLPRSLVVDPRDLGLTAGRATATGRIEAWLRARGAPDGMADPIAVAVGADLAFATGAQPQIDDWNATVAYPRFAVGDSETAVRVLRTLTSPAASAPGPLRTTRLPLPGGRPADTPDAFLPLFRVVTPSDPTPAAFARRFAFPVGGTLVFNPSPFGRSGTVAARDGVRVATDIPGLGYAFLPDAPSPEIRLHEGRDEAHGGVSYLRLDPSGGAIASLIDRATGRNLVAADGGLNALPDAVLTRTHSETIAGIGERVMARRVTASDVLTTTITVYDDLPWIDIENRTESGNAGPVAEWTFPFGHGGVHVEWEVAGGRERATVPVSRFAPLRWITLRGPEYTVLFGTTPGTTAAVDDAGTLTIRAPYVSRFRIAYQRGHLLPDDPWRFGFGMLPLVAVPTTGRGDRPLPTFGRMLDVADPTVATLAIRRAADGVGVMVFLQDLGGPARDIVVRPGLLAFDGAILADLAERDVRAAAPGADGAVLVPIEGSGYAAVRMLGVRLAV